jgi:IclR helix-turn-helix domain
MRSARTWPHPVGRAAGREPDAITPTGQGPGAAGRSGEHPRAVDGLSRPLGMRRFARQHRRHAAADDGAGQAGPMGYALRAMPVSSPADAALSALGLDRHCTVRVESFQLTSARRRASSLTSRPNGRAFLLASAGMFRRRLSASGEPVLTPAVRVFEAVTPDDTVLSVTQIARRARLHPATASRLVAELEAHGLLAREPDRREWYADRPARCVAADLPFQDACSLSSSPCRAWHRGAEAPAMRLLAA